MDCYLQEDDFINLFRIFEHRLSFSSAYVRRGLVSPLYMKNLLGDIFGQGSAIFADVNSYYKSKEEPVHVNPISFVNDMAKYLDGKYSAKSMHSQLMRVLVDNVNSNSATDKAIVRFFKTLMRKDNTLADRLLDSLNKLSANQKTHFFKSSAAADIYYQSLRIVREEKQSVKDSPLTPIIDAFELPELLINNKVINEVKKKIHAYFTLFTADDDLVNHIKDQLGDRMKNVEVYLYFQSKGGDLVEKVSVDYDDIVNSKEESFVVIESNIDVNALSLVFGVNEVKKKISDFSHLWIDRLIQTDQFSNFYENITISFDAGSANDQIAIRVIAKEDDGQISVQKARGFVRYLNESFARNFKKSESLGAMIKEMLIDYKDAGFDYEVLSKNTHGVRSEADMKKSPRSAIKI